jgi:hypothetical protein
MHGLILSRVKLPNEKIRQALNLRENSQSIPKQNQLYVVPALIKFGFIVHGNSNTCRPPKALILGIFGQ